MSDGQVIPRRKPTVTVIPVDPATADWQPTDSAAKPTLAGLGVDLAALDWQRSGSDAGSFEVALIASMGLGRGEGAMAGAAERSGRADWVLLRVAGDPAGRVLVFDRTEWMCFIDGAGHGEFDWPAELARASASAARWDAAHDRTGIGTARTPHGGRPRRRAWRSSCRGLSA